ncbi:hypothetical protein ACIBL5_13000 [Streptomyces sp. NPDC050516]|uniref:hypothetical protein n=1 Tax=Streptomyces sp. NPDC050516 TaxID=3365621 RepID=UPI0037AAB9AA
MTSEVFQANDLDALVAALAAGREMVVVAPNSTVNTGWVTGGQRHTVSTSAVGGPGVVPMRQGPVRAKELQAARRRFVPPPGFEEALVALESGISVLVGAPGTGRETHALNLLAHGEKDPVFVQVDGAVDLSRWVPRPQGVHGYLVVEPPDPFALRPWDLSRLEAPLAEAGARLLIMVADAPGLATSLGDHLGTPVLRHSPPDPRKVFSAHLRDACTDEDIRNRLMRALGPSLFDDLLPTELPPRHAAQAAEAVARLGTAGDVSCSEVLHVLARAEASDLVAQAQEDPVLLAHLLSLSVYGGLDRDIVMERATDLLKLAGPGWEQTPAAGSTCRQAGRKQVGATRQWSVPGTLRAVGAHFTRQADTDTTGTVSFYWPAVGNAVWEVLCREHADLLPLIHEWLAWTGYEPAQIERAGQAVAAVAVATGGRSLELLRHLALTQSPSAVEVAARCLGEVVRYPATTAKAESLLEGWSVAVDADMRNAVAYACRSDRGQLRAGKALQLIDLLMETLSDDVDDMTVAGTIAATLVQRFEEGDSRARRTMLSQLRDWAALDGVPGQMAALTFPAMAGRDLPWCGDQILSDAGMASAMVRLTGHALNESVTYTFMRDVLLSWCCELDSAPQLGPALEELLQGLVEAREPGSLRWLLSVERGPDSMPGKHVATRLLTVWRSRTSTPNTD